MSEVQAIAVRESTDIELGTLRADTPAALLAAASSIATPLAAMIEKLGLASNIQGKQYTRCEGWTTMGAMLGVVPQEVSNFADANGVYVATIELVNIKTGRVVGRASAECGAPDELDRRGNQVWSTRPAYARRSMAATRATSKAFRLSFSWIMVLAGFQPTPAEEVPDGGFDHVPVSENAAVREAATTGAPGFVLAFGKHKGTNITEVDNGYLHFLIETFEKNILDPAKASYKNDNTAKLRALVAEKARRVVNAAPLEDEERPSDGDLPFSP